MDPEYYEKLLGMVKTGDEAYITQADELASMAGHDGDSFSQDLKRYDQVSIMGEVGEFAHYLTDKHIEILMNIVGKDLRYGLYSWAGVGFELADGLGGAIGKSITPDDFYEMKYRIAAKKKDITDDDIDDHEGMDTGIAAAHKLAQAIMSLSRKTTVSMNTIEDVGIGEGRSEGGLRMDRSYDTGGFDFYYPEYEKLYKTGKLVITRN